MVLIDGHDLNIYYTLESAFGVVDDDSTWSPLLDVDSASGHGFSQERKDIRRHGSRKRVASPSGKIEQPDLQFTVFASEEAATLDTYSVFVKALFDSTYDVATPSYGFLFMNSTDASGNYFEYYYGCTFTEFEVTLTEGEEIKLVLTFMCQTSDVGGASELHDTGTTTYTAYPDITKYYLWSDIASIIKSGDFTNADTFTSISEFSITVTQEAEKLWRIAGQKYPSAIHMSGFEVTGSFTLDHEDKNQIDEMEDEVNGIITITVTTMGSFTLSGVTFDEGTFDTEPNSLLTMDVSFGADDIAFA